MTFEITFRMKSYKRNSKEIYDDLLRKLDFLLESEKKTLSVEEIKE